MKFVGFWLVILYLVCFNGWAKPFEKSEKIKFKTTQKILKPLWHRTLTHQKKFNPEPNQPVIDNGFVYVTTSDGEVTRLDVETGNKIWQIKLPHPLATTVLVLQHELYIVDEEGDVYKLAQSNGEILAQTSLSQKTTHGLGFCAGKIWTVLGESVVVALDTNDLAMRVHKTFLSRLTPMAIQGSSGFACETDGLYFGTVDGFVYKLTSQGEVVFKTSISRPLQPFKDVDMRLQVVDGSLLVAGYAGVVARINKNSGQILWQKELAVGSTPYIIEQKVYVTTQSGQVYALALVDGRELWFNDLGDHALTNPIGFGDFLFVAGDFEKSFVLKRDSGEVLQVLESPKTLNQVFIADQFMALLSEKARLVVYKWP